MLQTMRTSFRSAAAAHGDDSSGLEAGAPLVQRMGYTSWLSALAEQDAPQASAWLSRSLPIDDGVLRAARGDLRYLR